MGTDGALWVGTFGGLARLHEGAWEVFTQDNSDLPSHHVRALAVGTDGALWIGCEQVVTSTKPVRLGGGCLARLHEGVWKIFTAAEIGLPSDNSKGLRVWPGLSVEALAVGRDGALWVGTFGGLARLQDGAWKVFSAANSDLPNDSIQSLTVERNGALWVGTQSGLARLHRGAWEVFTAADSELPDDLVNALAVDADGALWVGTLRGLGRLHEGTWGFTAAASDLPNDFVLAMAVDPDGALWAGTEGGGLARTMYSRIPHPKLVPVLPPDVIAQAENTFAVQAFDPAYRSEPHEFRYTWVIERIGWLSSNPMATAITSSPYYTAHFASGGSYAIRVTAVDRYGRRSDPAVFEFEVELPELEPWLEWAWWAVRTASGISLVYLISLGPLLFWYPRAGWARSAVNSGIFSRFPSLHKSLLSSRWARRRLFKRYADKAAGSEELVRYIPQAVCPAGGGEPMPLAWAEDPFSGVRARGRYLLVLGRSGTGKSVLLHRLHRLEAARFRAGETASLPVLLDAPTHLGGKDGLTEALKDALRRDGKVELPDDVFEFLIRKGGFLILVDALNELPGAAEALKPFLNRDAANTVLMASQTDVLLRQDVAAFTMAEVAVGQAAAYLDATVGPGTWDALPPTLRALTRNPQDLTLIAEVAGRLGPENLPSRRAALYATKVEDDSALRNWVATADPRLGVVYALAFRMLAGRRVLDEPTLAEWIREALSTRYLESDEVGAVTAAIRRSRLFREDIALDRLGRFQSVLAFDHELIGAFLAARHVRAELTGPERATMLDLAEREEWQSVFFFIVDELSATMLPGVLLDDLLARGSDISLRIVAYALESQKDEDPPLPGRIRNAYATAKLRQDVELTPAAGTVKILGRQPAA